MPIKVTVNRAANGTPVTEEDHAAEHFVVRDGLLLVLSGDFRDSPVVAAYAPGAWSSVKREA